MLRVHAVHGADLGTGWWDFMFEGADTDDSKGHGGEGVQVVAWGFGDGPERKKGGRDFSVNFV